MVPKVETGLGRLRGEEGDGVSIFRGIPYAEPPVGPLRFQRPRPATGWSGERSAVSFAPSAPQFELADFAAEMAVPVPPHGAMDEDCLYLNVWTPACDDVPRPVLVWLHGGSFVMGSGDWDVYEASHLARRGDAVVITINYRLGVLGGFVYLNDCGVDELSGMANMGLLDQVQALRWVRDHVGAFGGDPNNVTVFGESAGASSIARLLVMPAAVGLFHKAILMSGAPVGRAGMLGETLDDVHYQAGEFLRDLDLTPDSAGKLLDMPTDMIVAAQTTYMNRLIPDRLMEPFCPTVDGKVIPEVPLEGIRQGRAAGIPVIVGWTADEWISLAAVDPDALTIDEVALLDRYERWLPGDDGAGNTLGRRLIEGYRDAWNGEGRPTPTDLLMALERDRMLRMPSLRVLDAQSPHQAATFAYQMNWRSALPGLGACHGIDLPLIFGTFDIPSWGRFVGSGAEVERLSATIQDSWVAFARTGDPNHSGLPSWPRYEETERATMLLGAQPEVVQDLARDERQVWDGVV